MKKIIGLLLISFSCFSANISLAQSSPPYTGGLEYALPWLTTLPPVHTGMPSDIASAYGYFDLAMRLSPGGSIYRFFQNMNYGDTSKFLVDYFYRVDNDNPVLFHQWLAESAQPNPYKTSPGTAKQEFLTRVARIFPDSDRTWMLLNSDIISHIHVTDTTMHYSNTGPYQNWVIVTAEIVDEIKGQFVPGCPLLERPGKGGAKPASSDIYQTYPDSVGLASGTITGTCIQFNYCLDWSRTPRKQGRQYYDESGDNLLFDSSNGAWIKPGQDYIVFLHFMGVGGDSINQNITIWPVNVFGWSCGMYSIKSESGGTIVSDENDDFGIGANVGLSPTSWKAALRARIYHLINP